MKTRIVALLSLFIANFALAETIPPGCYVADYYRTDPCWNATSNLYEWPTTLDRTSAAEYFGYAVEAIVYHGYLDNLDLADCNADYNNLNGQYNLLSGQYSTLSNQYAANDAQRVFEFNQLVAQYNKLLATSKKLRKKCGKPCKKIK